MSPRFRHRTTKKESRRWPRPTAAALEERIDEIMDRVARAGGDHVERAAVLGEYLTLARAHDGETWFDAGAWSEELADSYLALGRVDDAVTTIANATRWGCAPVTRNRPSSSFVRCARPACPRSGASPTTFRSRRPRGSTGERQEVSAGRPVRRRESHRARRAARCPAGAA